MTLASHVKIIYAKPYIFGTKKVYTRENVLDDLSMASSQGHGCDIDKQKFACQHDTVRTTHQIVTKLGSYIPLVMLLPDYVLDKFCWKFFGRFCFQIFGCVFSRPNMLLVISQEWLVGLTRLKKGSASLATG